MKILIVYYSSEGNTRFIAETIASHINAELLELKPKEDIPKSGILRYFWGGKQVMSGQKVPLAPLTKDAQGYDMIFIGTPVWAFSFAPALKTFFSLAKLHNKRIAIFCCHGGGKGKTLANMKNELINNEIVGEIDFMEPRERSSESCAQKAREWAKNIIENHTA
jgi:flavodoxin